MRDLHNNIVHVSAIAPITISGANLSSGNIDLAGFGAVEIAVHMGDIDELGGSPVGAAKLDVKLEHADDDGAGAPAAYTEVVLADVVGPTSVTGGVVLTTTSDLQILDAGYVGGKRFIRVTLQPTALTNGGPVGAWVVKGRPRHAPQ